MNLTQALTLSDGYCATSPDICDRCSRPVALLFNWDMIENLCMACFIKMLYEHNGIFVEHLKLAKTRDELVALCQEFQLNNLYFPPGPGPLPASPTYQTEGGVTMKTVQQSFIRMEPPADPDQEPVMIRELPEGERPVNRLHRYGPGALSTSELIAAIIQTPAALHTANRLLAKHHGLLGLARASTHELLEIPGLGPAKAAQLKAAMELGRRVLTTSPQDRLQIKSPADAANLMMLEMAPLEQEHMRLILLDSKNYVIDTPTMYVGNLNTSVIRIGELFREAIKRNCAAVIVVHNHPSGDPTPSPEDVTVTNLIVKAGELLDIQVLDHLIIGQQRYVSLKERGLGFE